MRRETRGCHFFCASFRPHSPTCRATLPHRLPEPRPQAPNLQSRRLKIRSRRLKNQSRRLKNQSRRLFFQSRRLNFQSRRLETQNPRPGEWSRVWVCGKCRGGKRGFISPPSACPWACGGGRCRRAGRAGGMRRAWWWPGAGPWGCTPRHVRRRPFRGGRCPWRGCP